MPVNLDKPARWKADIAQSVDMYNDWFMKRINPAIICEHPDILPTLRMIYVSSPCR